MAEWLREPTFTREIRGWSPNKPLFFPYPESLSKESYSKCALFHWAVIENLAIFHIYIE